MKILILLFLSMTAISCAKTESNWLMNPRPEYAKYTENGGTLSFDFNPKAEIIFVIDNSASMSKHIANVSENIDRFVEAFSRNNPLTYNLAVVSVYDSRTYESKTYQDKWSGTSASRKLGQFYSVKSSPTEVIPNKYFINSADENLKDMLRFTLKVGVQDLPSGGPEIEESFSPLAAIYNLSNKRFDENLANLQKSFFMGKDSYKIIFFITDASDASDISASELYYNLVAQSDGDESKIMAFAAIVPSTAKTCARDPGNLPYKIEEFLSLAGKNSDGANVASLCEEFGKQFDIFGKSVRDRTLAKVVKLNKTIPVINSNPDETLRVFYGSQELPFETAPDLVGFRYDPESNSVHINPNVELTPQPNAKLRIQYTSAKPTK